MYTLTVQSEDKAKIDAIVELAVSLKCSYKLQEPSVDELEDVENEAEDKEDVETNVSSPQSWQAGIEEQLAEMKRLIAESQTVASPTPVIVEEEKVIEKITVLSPEPALPVVPAYMRKDYWVYVAQQRDTSIIQYIGYTSQDFTQRWRDHVTDALQGEKRLSKWIVQQGSKGNIAIYTKRVTSRQVAKEYEQLLVREALRRGYDVFNMDISPDVNSIFYQLRFLEVEDFPLLEG